MIVKLFLVVFFVTDELLYTFITSKPVCRHCYNMLYHEQQTKHSTILVAVLSSFIFYQKPLKVNALY